MRRLFIGIFLLSAYELLLVITVTVIPLRLNEILQLMGSSYHSLPKLMGWVAQTPSTAPLNYFMQLPFVIAGGASRIFARLPSLVFALGSSYLFLRLATRIPVHARYLALVLFMLLPVHYRFATQGTPVEQGLFLILLATLCYFRLVQMPNFRAAALYGGLLILCLYTDPSSYLPALGYLLFLVPFVNSARGRRVIWFALPASIVPIFLFLPYYFWARPQANPDWLLERTYPPDLPIYLQPLYSIAAGGWNGYILATLLLAGTLTGAWASARALIRATSAGPAVLGLFGGVLSATAIPFAIDAWTGHPFPPSRVLWAVPAIIILSFAAVEWLPPRKIVHALTSGLALLCIVLSALCDAEYFHNRAEDFETEALLVRPQLTGDSCVVFVSQKLSERLFLLFDPGLAGRECSNFLHRRVVLASHPYLQPDQEQDAESFFRALNFSEKKRIRTGGGQIIVLEQDK